MGSILCHWTHKSSKLCFDSAVTHFCVSEYFNVDRVVFWRRENKFIWEETMGGSGAKTPVFHSKEEYSRQRSRREQIFPELTAFLGEKEYIIRSRTFRNWRKKIPALSVDLCDLEQIASLRDCGCACRACASLGGGDLEKCLHILALSHPNSHSCARERYSWITLQHHILPPCCSHFQIIAYLFFYLPELSILYHFKADESIYWGFSMCFVLEHFLENTLILSTYIWYTWCLILYQLW